MLVKLIGYDGHKLRVNPDHVAVILDERPMYAVRVVTVFGVEYAVKGTLDEVTAKLNGKEASDG